jgi:hypothetical protein
MRGGGKMIWVGLTRRDGRKTRSMKEPKSHALMLGRVSMFHVFITLCILFPCKGTLFCFRAREHYSVSCEGTLF